MPLRERLLAAAGPLLGALLFGLAIAILRHELAEHRLADVVAHLESIPARQVALALALTAGSYLTLTGYDTLAFRTIRNPLPYRRVALSSFIGFVFSHNVGLSVFGGSAVRYRMHSSWGVKPADIARVIALNLLTFWLGFFTLGGAAFALAPLPMPEPFASLVASSRPLGVALLAALAAYVAWSAASRQRAIRLWGFEIALPGLSTTAAQIAISCLDWTLAAGVLWVLLPSAPGLGAPLFLGAYLLAQVVGLASHVPAGLGVFESVMVVLLAPFLPGDQVLGSILAYRIVYYLIPLSLGVGLLGGYEGLQHRQVLQRAQGLVEQWLPAVVPRIFGVTIFLAGVLLLVSGATPAEPGRLRTLSHLLPLPAIELSHFLGSAIGVALLFLARALQQRIDSAYFLTLALLGAGAAASLVKGFDWEEACVLTAMMLALLPCRTFFYRRSSLLAQPFSAEWTVAIVLTLVGTAFVVDFAYERVAYSNELWWRFELTANAPRSLRALVGGALVAAAYAGARLLRPAPPVPGRPSPAEIERARAVVEHAPRTSAHLALLGDKQLLFHDSGRSFVMYGVEGRSWIAMGDPVGPAAERRELAWRFRELADRHNGRTAFYEVGSADLPVYVDLGLSLYKLGEEARVPLQGFSLAGGSRKGLRASVNRVEREGGSFAIVPPPEVPPLLDELQAVSTRWLEARRTREKRFSLGFFDRRYLSLLPLAVVRKQGRLVAFANVWCGAEHEELSVDLMRHLPDAPPGVMEYLFAELMLWGSAQGYRWFGLGMAPLAGLERHRLAPVWNRLGALLFRHGENFYNFQGLREFKDKFDPLWEPRYLASSGRWTVGLVLAHVASLISGGAGGVIAK
jgi:phosphatidylglycerol lysyltransferase